VPETYAEETTMTNRNFKQELYYSYYEDMEDGRTTETIDYAALIGIIAELCDRIEQLEKDNELLKSYAWEQ
jgi:ketopantoate reductase